MVSVDFKALSVLDNPVPLQTISYVSSTSLQRDLAGFIWARFKLFSMVQCFYTDVMNSITLELVSAGCSCPALQK